MKKGLILTLSIFLLVGLISGSFALISRNSYDLENGRHVFTNIPEEDSDQIVAILKERFNPREVNEFIDAYNNYEVTSGERDLLE